MPKDKANKNARLLRMALLLSLPLATLIFVATNHLHEAIPKPVWTRADLPLPAEEVNGWSQIRSIDLKRIQSLDPDPLYQLIAAASRNGTKLSELHGGIRRAAHVAAKLRDHTRSCEQAFSQPRMVLPCLSAAPKACSAEPLLYCSRLLRFASLQAAAGRRWARAQKLTVHLVRRSHDAATHSRHPWNQTRALSILRSAIHLSANLIKWRRVGLTPLHKALADLNARSLPLERLVVANYLLKRAVLSKGVAAADTFLLDKGALWRAFDAPFAAVKKGKALAAPDAHTSGLFWWFHNAVGKRMLNAIRPGADEDFQRSLKLRDNVLKRRQQALGLFKPKQPQRRRRR